MAGFMIAAPRSGSGKTMVTCGILELLKRKQKNPFSYKCGPDYIDGLFHRKVLGIEGGNLDSFFERPEDMRKKLIEANYSICNKKTQERLRKKLIESVNYLKN